MDLVGILGLLALILGVLVVLKVLAWGIPIGVVLIIVGLLCLLGGFGPRLRGRL
jgi:hypothetical protein